MKKITVYTYQTIGGYIVETVNKSSSISSDTFLGARTIEFDEPQKVHSFTEEQLNHAWGRTAKNCHGLEGMRWTFENFLRALGVK